MSAKPSGRCGGMGICFCGAPVCEDRMPWSLFCMSWLSVAWAMTEQSGYRRPNTFCDWLEQVDDPNAP